MSLIYAVGDYNNWWDKLSGRTAVIEGIQSIQKVYNFEENAAEKIKDKNAKQVF